MFTYPRRAVNKDVLPAEDQAEGVTARKQRKVGYSIMGGLGFKIIREEAGMREKAGMGGLGGVRRLIQALCLLAENG